MPAGDKGEANVDTSIWLGVAFFLLSIPMGIATNMLTPRFVAYLEKRKLVKSNRTKEQDIASYRQIEAFKNGTRDKYASYIGMAVLAIFFAIGGNTLLILMTIRNPHLEGWQLSPPDIFLPLLAIFSLLISTLMLISIFVTSQRIERFDDYAAELRKKWGDDVI
jgi:hypothetical protein